MVESNDLAMSEVETISMSNANTSSGFKTIAIIKSRQSRPQKFTLMADNIDAQGRNNLDILQIDLDIYI